MIGALGVVGILMAIVGGAMVLTTIVCSADFNSFKTWGILILVGILLVIVGVNMSNISTDIEAKQQEQQIVLMAQQQLYSSKSVIVQGVFASKLETDNGTFLVESYTIDKDLSDIRVGDILLINYVENDKKKVLITMGKLQK